jgi:hypothetical protein
MGALRLLRPTSTVWVGGTARRRKTMTDSLRPLRIRLVDPSRVGELLEFLRRRSCVVEQVDAVTLDVWPPPLLHEGNNGDELLALEDGQVSCAACGDPVEEALSRLGSPRCHDCRAESLLGHPLGAAMNGDAHHRHQRARLEVQAYLRAWRAEHDGAVAALSDS